MPRQWSETTRDSRLEGVINVSTKITGTEIDTSGYRNGYLLIDFAAVTGTPTVIQFFLETKSSTGNWHKAGATFWQDLEYEDTVMTSQLLVHFPFYIPGKKIRFSLQATGADGSNFFTINLFEIQMGT